MSVVLRKELDSGVTTSRVASLYPRGGGGGLGGGVMYVILG